ncbi:sensor histidine kinase [Spirillospora sp. CA-128828]|uniref:sensor histidine kinase n=1 Tax=Spirillospora sp. CA-128828 TaxID=3240033 RepID=UPI003D8F0671
MRQGGGPVAATVVCVAAWAVLARTAFESGGHGAATLEYLIGVVPLGLGWLIGVRVPGNPVGAALAWLAAFMLATPAVELWGELAWPGSGVIAVVGAGAWPWQLVGFLVLLLVFPEGLPARWTLLLPPAAALVMNVAFVVTMNYHEPSPGHSPISVPRPLWGPVMIGAMVLLLAVVVFCLGTVVRRYRRGGERLRRQLRWLILGAAAVVVLMVASWGVTSLGWVGAWAYAPFLVGIIVLVPAAVTVAVLWEDLFSIERILSDSVAWALTTTIAAVVLAAAVVGAGYLAGRDSAAGLSGAVFVVALAVLPLHRYVHHAVGRVLDRERTVLLEGIRRFVDGVREGSAEPEGVEGVLRDAVGDPGLMLLLTDVDGTAYVDAAGRAAAPAAGARVPLRTADTEIGVVVVPDGTARRIRRARLAASAARLPIEVSRLRLGLRRALQDVDDSRRRLLAATLAERQRLERDLHDGAQQQLVGLGMHLRLLQRQLAADDPARAELDGAVERIEQIVAELRRLAHGVRPAGLDDGLAAALRRIASGSPIPISFAVDDVTASELVATTAYFVVAEAVANTLKHARATRIDVTVRRDGDRLRVAVTDDGLGGAEGLIALRDRVGSIGGTFSCTSSPATGTVVAADLPWSSPCAS